jgi:hypothetical protein
MLVVVMERLGVLEPLGVVGPAGWFERMSDMEYASRR